MDTDNTQIELNLAIRALQERTEAEQKAANDLLGLQISNAQRLLASYSLIAYSISSFPIPSP